MTELRLSTDYPKRIKEVIREAPLWYAILILDDYNKRVADANTIWRRWQKDKPQYK
jgi:hypothetical protein